MFETLSEKLQRVFKNLRGEGKLSEQHLDEALREIRVALLEADVNFKVVKQFTDAVRSKALGQEVMQSLSPGQQVVKIVRDELIEMLGGTNVRLNFAAQPPTVIMLVGLQGSGKTTTSGKVAKWLQKGGHRPMLVSVDVYRPAARDQLKVIAKDVGVNIWEGHADDKPLQLCQDAAREARNTAHDVVVIDTAGRLHIDEALMNELREIKDNIHPNEILFVADAMLGQDAVKSAQEFHQKLGFNGFILTKMDGDARGGAALSIKQVTGQPVKFVGTGEKYEALELFHPDRLVSRIMGMGDILSLIEKAEEVVDKKKAAELQEKMLSDNFTLDDFRDQLKQIRKMGALDQILAMLPSIGPFKDLQKVKVDEKELVRVEAIINSMTPKERRNHQLINGSRRKRIAKGSGTSVQQVNQLLKQYAQTRKMMKGMKNSFFGKRLKGMKLPEMPF
ncbi:MAG: signal recognition particle protein [Acidobacteria bacterium]|nr:MAG: signal recognition particle protein [Acidobacteriota bacterium]